MNKFIPIALVALISAPAAANDDFYLTLGFGEARIEQNGTPGWWNVNGIERKFDEKTNTWEIGAGYKLTANLATEFSYQNLGEFNSFTGYPIDADNTYDNHSMSCPGGPCPPTIWSHHHGEVELFKITARYEFPSFKGFTPYVKGGYHRSRTTFEVRSVVVGDPTNQYGNFARNYATSPYKDVNRDTHYGIGISKGNWALEYTKFFGVGSGNDAYDDASSFMFRYRVAL